MDLGGQDLSVAQNFHSPKTFFSKLGNEVNEIKTQSSSDSDSLLLGSALKPKPLNLSISPNQPSEPATG